ncbi:MAG: cytochrome c oxidase subunit II [Actinomycetota bacterium]|nr:cytochrome c oxidase subunit II [Actinomycetota bacterium]
MVLAAALVLSGCGAQLERGYLPEAVTESGPNVIDFWNATWIAALAVGVLVWGLILWCVVAYRRKKSDTGLPEQIRYNVPLEILYTVVPVLMMAVLFGKTVELQNELLDTEQEADVVVNVVGKQWSWDFNYVNEDVYITGTQAIELSRGEPGLPETLPTLVLPVDARVEFVLTARDVIHSFWVPQFLQKLDMLPGRVNVFQVTTTEEGSFTGKCAELCGAYHSQMLFEVDVVSQQEYDQHIADLEAAGNTGQLDNGLNRAEFIDGQVDKLPEGSN